MLVQKKQAKEKDTRVFRPPGSLRFSSPAGLSIRGFLPRMDRTDIPVGPLRAIPASACDARRNTRFQGVRPNPVRRSRAPERFTDQARRGAAGKRRLHRGRGSARRWSPGNREERREPAWPVAGRFFFGYFLLSDQKKVARNPCAKGRVGNRSRQVAKLVIELESPQCWDRDPFY